MQGFLNPSLTRFSQHEHAVPARAVRWALNSFCLLTSDPGSGYFPHLEVPPHLLKSYICLRADKLVHQSVTPHHAGTRWPLLCAPVAQTVILKHSSLSVKKLYFHSYIIPIGLFFGSLQPGNCVKVCSVSLC